MKNFFNFLGKKIILIGVKVNKMSLKAKICSGLIGVFCVSAIVVPTTVCLGGQKQTVIKYFNTHAFQNVMPEDNGSKPTRQMIIDSVLWDSVKNSENHNLVMWSNFGGYEFSWKDININEAEGETEITHYKFSFLGNKIVTDKTIEEIIEFGSTKSRTVSHDKNYLSFNTAKIEVYEPQDGNISAYIALDNGIGHRLIPMPKFDEEGRIIWPYNPSPAPII